MDNQREMREFADNIGKYIVEKHVKPLLEKYVGFFKAEVKAAPSGGVISVQKPFDNTVFNLPYTADAAGLAVGDQCTVFVLGSMTNAVVVGDGSYNAV